MTLQKLITSYQEKTPLMHVIFGSKLYGTQTQDSDNDSLLVFANPLSSIIIGEDHNARHTIDGDEDVHQMCLKSYIQTLSLGQMALLEAFFAPKKFHLIQTHPSLTRKRDDIIALIDPTLPKSMGFIKKILCNFTREIEEKIKTVEEIKALLKETKEEDIQKNLISYNEKKQLPEDDFYFCEGLIGHNIGIFLSIYSKKINIENIRINDVIGRLDDITIPWKKRLERTPQEEQKRNHSQIAHLWRMLDQVEEFREHRTLTFPVKNAEWIKEIKFSKNTEILDNCYKICEERYKNLEKIIKKEENNRDKDFYNNRLNEINATVISLYCEIFK